MLDDMSATDVYLYLYLLQTHNAEVLILTEMVCEMGP